MHKYVDIWDESIHIPNDVYVYENSDKAKRYERFNFGKFYPNSINSTSELWEGQPHRFFIIKVNGKVYLGSKTISEIVTKHGSPGFFCSKVSKEMILGELEYFQTSQVGVEVFYSEVEKAEIESVFEFIKNDSSVEIHYPFVQLVGNDKQEISTPSHGWHIDENRANLLGLGELHLRQLSADFLRRFNPKGLVVYDPACSTGQFLYELKLAHPEIYTIGQDISPEMIKFAEGKADELHVGDSLNPKPARNSVDIIFFRFLNAEVISRLQAIPLFKSVMGCLKDDGYGVIFGHTPVLLNKSELAKEGYHVHSCNKMLQDGSVVQFYVIQKKRGFASE